jgi:hypothetical protein
MSSLVHKGGSVKREAEAVCGTDKDVGAAYGAGEGVEAACGAGWGAGAACGARGGGTGATHYDKLRSTCNRRGVGWSNWANRSSGREEGVQVIGRWVGGGKGK